MRAIIFASGKGSRLGTLTNNIPKSCLKLEDTTVLGRALSLLDSSKVFDEVIILTGHKSEVIDEEIRNWPQLNLRTIFNPEYEARNNIYTAYLVRELIDENTLIFNSDIVYDQRILELAINETQNNDSSFLVVDDSKASIDEDMKVILDSKERIVRIHKNLDNASAAGEYIGILRLNEDDSQSFSKSLQSMIISGFYDKYYEDALDKIASELNLQILSSQGYEWTEIDTPEDYQKAQNLICVKSQYQNSLR
jgi:choline kinase